MMDASVYGLLEDVSRLVSVKVDVRTFLYEIQGFLLYLLACPLRQCARRVLHLQVQGR